MKYKKVKKKRSSNGLEPLLFWVVVAFFVLLPFVVSLDGLEKFRTPKDVFSVAAIVILIAIFLLSRRFRIRFFSRSWEALVGLSVAYVGVHSLLGERPEVSLAGFVQIVYFVALLYILIEFLSPNLQRRLWLWIGAAMALNAVLTIVQYYGLFSLMERPTGELLEGRLIPAGFIGDVNSGGFLFGLSALILLHGVVAREGTKIRVLSGLLLIINLAGLIYTRTLTALLALGLAFLLWAVFHCWWVLKTQESGKRVLVFLGSVAIIAILILGLVLTGPGLRYRIQLVWNQVKSGQLEVATAGRYPIYLLTWEMIKERPWLGSGLNTFKEDFFHHRAGTEFGRGLKLLSEPGSYRETHNEYLQIWDELGLVGLILFFLLFLIPLAKGVRHFFRTRDYWVGMLCVGTVYLAFGCLGFFPLHLSVTAAFAVLLFANLRYFQSQERLSIESVDPSRWLHWRRGLKPVLLLAVTALLLYFQVGKWRANQEAGLAAALLNRAVSGSSNNLRLKRAIAETASEKLALAAERFPDLYEVHNLRGAAAMLLGRHQAAIGYYGRAALYLPSPETLTNLGAAYLAAGQPGLAQTNVELALHYNPSYPRAQEALDFIKKGHR